MMWNKPKEAKEGRIYIHCCEKERNDHHEEEHKNSEPHPCGSADGTVHDGMRKQGKNGKEHKEGRRACDCHEPGFPAV